MSAVLKFTGKLSIPIKATVVSRKLETLLVREQKNAIRAWAIAVINKIPTYTGTALGSFAPISRIIRGLTVTARPISARARNKITQGTDIKGKHYALGFTAGAQYAAHAITHTVSIYEHRYTFEFVNDLPYVLWNSIQPAPTWMHLKNEAPTGALQAGERAFIDYVKREFPRAIHSIPLLKAN